MSLKERLARLERTMPTPLARHGQRSQPDLCRLLPGSACENDLGGFWRHITTFQLSHRHGRQALCALLSGRADVVRTVARDASLGAVALEQLVFIDTETTGLSGGVGTLAFLIGAGYFAGDRFVVEQYFLRSFQEERPMLHAFHELLRQRFSARSALVSFNGKSYDLPLLASRAILHRLRDQQPVYPHLDLLHAARRLWKKNLPGCSLKSLESAVLQIERSADVPAELIPGLYFSYLRSADPRPLLPVFAHNQADILSMVSLLDLMVRLYADSSAPHEVPVDVLAMGRTWEDLRDYDAGLALYERALRRADQAAAHKDILLAAARLHKKKRAYQDAVRLWERALDWPGFCAEPYAELAKVCEHHLHDLAKARSYAERALQNISVLEQLGKGHGLARARADFVRRLQRLAHKEKSMHRV